MVISEATLQNAHEMGLIEQDHMIQAFSSDRADQPLFAAPRLSEHTILKSWHAILSNGNVSFRVCMRASLGPLLLTIEAIFPHVPELVLTHSATDSGW